MKKTLKAIILMFIFVLIFIQYSFAADVANVKVNPSRDILEIGDKVELEISILNNSITDGISEVYGAIDFDTESLELVKIDYEEALEGANTITKTIIENFKEEDAELLYVSDEWCIAGLEENGEYGFAAFTISNPIEVSTSYTEIGAITLQVIDSAESGNVKPKLTNITFKDGEEVSDAISSVITINAEAGGDMQEIREEDDYYEEDNDEQETGTAEGEAPYTGVEDIIPFIVIAMIIGIIGYIKYKKYQGI